MNTRRIEKTAASLLPEWAKIVSGKIYGRLREIRANRAYQPADANVTIDEESPIHVVLLVVDGLRYDYLDDETAPFISEQNLVNAVAPATWTFPSVSSLVTGLYPHEHGAMRSTDDASGATESGITIPILTPELTTLPEILGAAGVDTFGSFGFDMPFLALRGRFQQHRLYWNRNAERILNDNLDWIRGHSSGRTFSFVHLSDLHTPLEVPAEYVTEFDVDASIDGLSTWRYTDATDLDGEVAQYVNNRRELYRAAIKYVDDTIREYYTSLQSEFGNDATLILTSDHGEGLWEHAAFDAAHFTDSRPAYCVGHGGTPYEPVTRVPLWLDDERFENTGRTSLIDVMPTILDLYGISDVTDTTGQLLLTPRSEHRVLLTEATRYGHEKKAASNDDWKLIVSRGDEVEVGHRISDDPGEGTVPTEVRDRLLNSFPTWPSEDISDEREVSGAVERRLEQLGYR